jgi:hypothetical protein
MNIFVSIRISITSSSFWIVFDNINVKDEYKPRGDPIITFLLLGAAIAAVFALAHPRIPVVGQQQTLSEQGNKTDTEE